MTSTRGSLRCLFGLGMLVPLLLGCGSPRAPTESSGSSPPAAGATELNASPTLAGRSAGSVSIPATGSTTPPVGPALSSLPTSAVVNLDVQVSPTASYGPLFIAHDRGLFQEMGLNVTLHSFPNVIDSLPALVQGQLQVGVGSSSAGVLNALNRQTDVAIVADLTSAGQTEKSTGNNALVARKDLWDAGVIRTPRDLLDRTVYTVAPGSGTQAQVVRWLRANGLDDSRVQFATMAYPEMMLSMKNRAIEVAAQSEPFVTQGVADGTHVSLATQEEMHPGLQLQFLMYWKPIDTRGPQVGTRFMVAYLRAVRLRLEAFEYGEDQDAIIQILVNNLPLKDPEVYRRSKYPWVDPNGIVNREALERDAELWRELGVLRAETSDTAGQFDDTYRRRAVDILGEYSMR